MADGKDYANSGVMYMNQNRREGKNDANGTGNGEVNCEKCGHKNSFWINGWRKDKDRDGNPWWSFSFKAKKPIQPIAQDEGVQRRREEPQQSRMSVDQQQKRSRDVRELDDDFIPF